MNPLKRRQMINAYVFMTPSLIIIVLFFLFPMVSALRISLYNYPLLGEPSFIGTSNYVRLLSDNQFANAVGNTIYYAGVTTPLSVAGAVGLAVMLNRRMVGRGFFRAAIFLPSVTSLAIVAIAWLFLLDPNIGLVNYWLGQIGLHSGAWLTDPDWAMPAVILVGIWRNIGLYMVMYLAGLQDIPRDLYEAAELDGTGAWQRFRYVTWPLLSNVTMFVVIIAFIHTLQAFDQIFVMTGGGPYFQTDTLVTMIYRVGFENFEFGYASAISYVLVLGIFAVSLVHMRYFRRREVTY